jgi:VanZ family protein
MLLPKLSRDTSFPGCSIGGAVWVIPFNRLLFALSTTAIVVLCLIPRSEVPRVGLNDKVEHVIAYAMLTLLGVSACRSRKALCQVVAFLLCLGLLVESLQSIVPGRSTDVADALANAGGIVLGPSLRLALCRAFGNESR